MLSNDELHLLKSEIERIHRNRSCDYEGLMRQVGKKYRVLRRNAAQRVAAQADLAGIKKKTGIMSRGVGKTTYLGDHFDYAAHSMPRSVGNIIVPSYTKFRKEMMPALSKSLEMLGYFEGLHYFIGKKPPASWKWATPYMKPTDWSNIIYWHTGAIEQLVSQDVKGAGRALSVDREVRDEAALLNKAKLEEATSATLRGSNVEKFKTHPLFGSIWNLSSMPITPEGMWLLEDEVNARLDPKTFAYLEFDVSCNLQNLRPGYVTDALKTAMYRWIFDAEFLNIRPSTVVGAFYSLLKESKHGYIPTMGNYVDSDDCVYDMRSGDLSPNLPLIVGVDWGKRINYMVVNQLQEGQDGKILKAMNEFWALGEDGEIQDDMVVKFAEYYRVFPMKSIILFCDRTGNIKMGQFDETRTQTFINQLSKLGWRVQLATQGFRNPDKAKIRGEWEAVLKENDSRLPKFRVNLLKCRNLLISMLNAQIKTGKTGITKDKKSENPKSGVHPTHATDPSDAEDYVIDGLLGNVIFSNEVEIFKNINSII